MNIDLPEWLRGMELELEFDSYEKLDALLRSHLKSQIAALHEMWKPESRNVGAFENLPEGGRRLTGRKALDWALFVLAEDYASPVGFTAALLPALMAGPELIIIVRAGRKDTPVHTAIASALELLGQEEIFALTPDECSRLAAELADQSPYGKVITLGAGFMPAARALPAQVRIGLDGAKIDESIMAWLHPGAKITDCQPDSLYDAVITASLDFFQPYPASLVLGPGYEYFWQWAELAPDFFQRRSVFISQTGR